MNVCQTQGPGGSKAVPFGPFTPDQTQSTYFVMHADDCALHFNLEELTPKQQEDHESNIVLTAMLQVALTYMGTRKDHAALHELFKEEPWASTLLQYQQIFAELLEDVIPPEHYHYFPRDSFYDVIAITQLPADLLNLYMISGSNRVLHQSREALEVSQVVNSKMHLAQTASEARLPVPATLLCKKTDLGNKATAAFFKQCNNEVMLKIQGLAGARNVTAVSSMKDATAYVAEYADDLDVLLQARLQTNQHTEMTVDLKITDTSVEITNVRKILFAEGLWVGNYISDKLTLSPRQQAVCMQTGEYVRNLGYSSPQGYNCGLDFFVAGDDITLIEINARWTGGLFPAHLLQRLNLMSEDSIAFIDILSRDRLDDYMAFLQQHLHGAGSDGAFRLLPMGFSPFVQVMDGIDRLYMWQIVAGDFQAFQQAKNEALGASELPTADLIRM